MKRRGSKESGGTNGREEMGQKKRRKTHERRKV